MKVLFVTDLHGSIWKYDRLFSTAQTLQADVVVNGGDMLPKDGELFAQDKFITEYLDAHFAKFDAAGIDYLCYLGNDDLIIFDELFDKTCSKYTHVTCLAQRKVSIRGFEFIGMNWLVDYPFQLKDRCRMDTEDYLFQNQFGPGLLSTREGWKEIKDWYTYAKGLPTMEQELQGLIRPENMSRSVYVIHMPPTRLGLDECWNGSQVGSKALYKFIQENQPLLTLHGHIHESPEQSGKWYAQLGRTVCIQPGQLGPFTFVTIDLHTMKCERYTEDY